MVAPFKCDEKVTIEHDIGGVDPDYGTPVPNWVPLLDRYWASVQDVLPRHAEAADNGLLTSVRRAHLRMQGAAAVTTRMRAVLHSRGGVVMKIIAGPAQLDDRVHYELQMEAY